MTVMCLFNLIALALANELMATPSDILILNIEIIRDQVKRIYS